MAEVQDFRPALNGFNRQDVVRYIEYLNNKHNAQITQLNAQLRAAQEALEQAQTPVSPDLALTQQLEEEIAKNARLEQTVAELRGALAQNAPAPTSEELEAYRRAERTERQAQERARQIGEQANAALADAAVRIDEALVQISTAAEQVNAQLQQYHAVVEAAKSVFQDASTALYGIHAED